MGESEKMQLNIGICDDEPLMVEILKQKCIQTLGQDYSIVVDTATSPAELLAGTRPFHLALLDVQLLEESGIELAKQILERNSKCRILFVSGQLHAVSDVYEVPHFCFILKEHLEEQLPKFLRRAAELSAKEAGQRIMISCGRKISEICLSDISVLERKGHITYVRLLNGQVYQTKEKLSELLLRIRDSDFIRCHVSFVVNLHNTASLDGTSFTMNSGEKIPISRPNEGACRDAFFRHLAETME